MPSITRPPAARWAAALLASSLALASCQRGTATSPGAAGAAKQPAPPVATPAPARAGTAAGAAPSKAAPAPQREGSASGPSARAASPAAVAPVDAGLHVLLARGAQDGTLPEDFEIGPLGAARLLADDARAAFEADARLLDAFTAGRVDRAGIAAGSRDALSGMLAFALAQGDPPAAWRLGPPRANGAELVANLRLLGTDGSAEGEIYARREGGILLVSDLQIDPARIRVRRERPDRTFFPSPYRWLLGG